MRLKGELGSHAVHSIEVLPQQWIPLHLHFFCNSHDLKVRQHTFQKLGSGTTSGKIARFNLAVHRLDLPVHKHCHKKRQTDNSANNLKPVKNRSGGTLDALDAGSPSCASPSFVALCAQVTCVTIHAIPFINRPTNTNLSSRNSQIATHESIRFVVCPPKSVLRFYACQVCSIRANGTIGAWMA